MSYPPVILINHINDKHGTITLRVQELYAYISGNQQLATWS